MTKEWKHRMRSCARETRRAHVEHARPTAGEAREGSTVCAASPAPLAFAARGRGSRTGRCEPHLLQHESHLARRVGGSSPTMGLSLLLVPRVRFLARRGTHVKQIPKKIVRQATVTQTPGITMSDDPWLNEPGAFRIQSECAWPMRGSCDPKTETTTVPFKLPPHDSRQEW